jgi:hypothetical protein
VLLTSDTSGRHRALVRVDEMDREHLVTQPPGHAHWRRVVMSSNGV